MFINKEFKNLPWHIISQVSFDGLTFTINFNSGNALTSTAPDQTTWNEFRDECLKNLKADQIKGLSDDN